MPLLYAALHKELIPHLVCSYDHDKDGAKDEAQDFIGSAETSIGEVVGIHRGTYSAVRV
jgi:hypothetical protein